MARVQSSTPAGGGVDKQFRCCDGSCGRTDQRPAPLCTHMNHGMESDDPEVAAMHLAYATTFDPSVYLRCVPQDGCPRSGHHVFHGAQAAARAATCQFCSPPPPTAPPPGVALPASAAGVRALQRQHAPAAASAAHDAPLAATARWCATSDVYRKMPRTPLRGTAVGVCPAARHVLFPLLDRTLAYDDRFPPTDDRSYGAEGAVCVFAGLLLRPYPSSSPAVELRRARQALDTADLGMVSDAAAALPALDALHPPPAATGPEYSPHEEPPDLQRAPPSWGDNADEVMRDLDVSSWRMWANRCLAGRCHSRTAAFLASGSVFALHKDDPAAREEREKSGEPLRVRPLGVGSVLVRLASAHALGQVGADTREVMGPDGAVYLGAPISHYPEWMTGALGRRREAHATLLERIASFATSGYGCHHGAMRLLVVCAVRQTGFLNRMMPPSELDPFLEAVDAANISAAFSLFGMDACDQSTPRMEAAIVQMSMPAGFGGLNLALLQSEALAAFYSAQSVVLTKLVREYGPALGPLYEAVRAEVSSVATSALPWARETRRVYETVRALTTLPQ
eukprot:jgi/Tetstr1/445497/TSEL_033273.t1